MPRQSRSTRPAARPHPRPAPQQQRSASTASVPAKTTQHPPPAVPQQAAGAPQQGPGLFGQMASTAAGVAVGSSIGHTIGAGISGLFGGGSSAAAAEAQPAQQPLSNSKWESTASCDGDAKALAKCLEDYKGDMQTCSYYLEQLKMCQNMAKEL